MSSTSQGRRVLETERLSRLTTRLCPYQRSDILLCTASYNLPSKRFYLLGYCRAISCSVFAIVQDTMTSEASFAVATTFELLGSPTLLCILGSHLFFNLKEAAEHGVNVGTNWASYSHSAIRFDESGSLNSEGECVSTPSYLNF